MSLPVLQPQSDRCSGHCCRKFFLPFTPAELVEAVSFDIAAENYDIAVEGFRQRPKKKQSRKAKRRLARKHPKVVTSDLKSRLDDFGHRRFGDIRQIADMVEYLGWSPVAPDMDYGEPGQMGNHYRCKNLLASGDCGIYETRPYMCRSYPNSGRCRYVACTWAKVKESSNGEA